MVDHLLTRQQGKPIHLISDDVRRLALHYCVAVRKAANRLASELCEAVGHRLGLGPEQQKEVQRRIQDLIQERTSAKAAGAVIAYITSLFTIGNPKEGEEILANCLAGAADEGLLISQSLDI